MTDHTPSHVVHRASERGGGDHGWLRTRHSFSFANWYEPSRMGFGALRVINDDTIAPHSGFGTHGHRDMEIITIVREGTLTHKDSMGNTGILSAGDVQVMSAGTGVMHSEYNEGDEIVRLFQIWIVPNETGGAPRYDQRKIEMGNGEVALVAPMGHRNTLNIRQDAHISLLSLKADESFQYALKDAAHGVYLFIIEGSAEVLGEALKERDAIGVEGAATVTIASLDSAKVLVLEVPMR